MPVHGGLEARRLAQLVAEAVEVGRGHPVEPAPGGVESSMSRAARFSGASAPRTSSLAQQPLGLAQFEAGQAEVELHDLADQRGSDISPGSLLMVRCSEQGVGVHVDVVEQAVGELQSGVPRRWRRPWPRSVLFVLSTDLMLHQTVICREGALKGTIHPRPVVSTAKPLNRLTNQRSPWTIWIGRRCASCRSTHGCPSASCPAGVPVAARRSPSG